MKSETVLPPRLVVRDLSLWHARQSSLVGWVAEHGVVNDTDNKNSVTNSGSVLQTDRRRSLGPRADQQAAGESSETTVREAFTTHSRHSRRASANGSRWARRTAVANVC